MSTPTLSPETRLYDDRGDTVAVIGAGASGLMATKNLREHGLAVDCYERETGVGGLWNWRHDRSPVYATTHLVSSRATSSIPDFPMPDTWPDYPHHSQVLTYLNRYADHFDLRRHLWLGTEVVRVQPTADGRWDLTTRGSGGPAAAAAGATGVHRYRAVVVANGHHWSPLLPGYQGVEEYGGEVMHASRFTDPASLRGRRVLVVGAGNTGCDIAVEAAQRAAACWHSTRRGYWYVPKYLAGTPVDQLQARALAWRLPPRVRQWLFHRLLRLAVGDLRRFGLPEPDHRVLESHPIVNSQLVYYLGHGRITPVPDVARFHAGAVELVSGELVDPDLVILATGYGPRFGFLEPPLLDLDQDGRPRLAMHLFSQYPTLAVVGLVQADAGLFPLMHWQSVVLARWLRRQRRDPERAERFWTWLAGQSGKRWNEARMVDSPRHWCEVSYVRYLRGLQRALEVLE